MKGAVWRLIGRQGLAKWQDQGFIRRLSPAVGCHGIVLRRAKLSTLSGEQDSPSVKLQTQQPSKDERDWLAKARLYGVESIHQLLSEADIGHSEHIGSKLTDDPVRRRNLGLWLLLLEINRNRRGVEGVKATWHAMNYRGFRVNLDPRIPAALILLRAFIAAGAEDVELMWQISRDCINSQRYRHWQKLYVEVVGTVLQHQPQYVTAFSAYIRKHCLPNEEDLLQLVQIACESKVAHTLNYFFDIYKTLPRPKIYENVITYLWQKERSSEAFLMHNFLLSQQDLPPTVEVLQPFVRHIARTTANLSPFSHSLAVTGVSFEAQLRAMYTLERAEAAGHSPEALNILAASVLVDHSKKLSDGTIARAFATTAFSFDFMLNGLRLLGLVEIGPLAARQMGIISEDASTLKARFERLHELGIDTGSSKFVKIIKRVCASGNSDLLASIVNCDLHHDTFDDEPLQRRLLEEYYRIGDTVQMNRTLAILNDGDYSVGAQERSANLLLRIALKQGDFSAALKFLNNMRRQGQKVSRTAAREMLDVLLRRKRDHLSKSANDIDECGLLVGILQQLLVTGSHIELTLWRRPLTKLGQEGRIGDLEALTLWLAEWYGFDGLNRRFLERPLYGKECDLNRLFDPGLQQKIISWGMRCTDLKRTSANKRRGLLSAESNPWLRGAALLKTLRDKHGVVLRLATLRHSFVSCLTSDVSLSLQRRGRRSQFPPNADKVALYSYLSSWAAFWNIPSRGGWIRRYNQKLQRGWPGYVFMKDTRRRPTLRKIKQVDLRRGSNNEEVTENSVEGVVGYRDLFNASWEEYKK